MMHIEKTRTPKKSDIDFLTQKINEETSRYGRAAPFAFFMRDDAKKIIAAANGYVMYGTIYTDQLWVDASYRKQGLARQLMHQVHELGIDEGCTMATVSTMDFQQATGFYEKLGYLIDFVRKGYINHSACLFLRKDL